MSMPGTRVDFPLPVGALSNTQNPGCCTASRISPRICSMGNMRAALYTSRTRQVKLPPGVNPPQNICPRE